MSYELLILYGIIPGFIAAMLISAIDAMNRHGMIT